MLQMAKSLLKSNTVIDSLKDDGLYKKAVQFRHVNAEQSQLNVIDRAFRDHDNSKTFNSALQDKAERISYSLDKAEKGSAKYKRLHAQQTALQNHLGIDDAEFAKRKQAVIDGGKKKRRDEYAEAMKQPGTDLRRAVSDYYTTGSGMQKGIRAGATIGALGVGAVGTRYMSGGTATTNNKGQRDIAGIPFV